MNQRGQQRAADVPGWLVTGIDPAVASERLARMLRDPQTLRD
jgi:hypothetical protein